MQDAMSHAPPARQLPRRSLIALALATLAAPALAREDPLAEAVRAVLGEAVAREGGLVLRVPALAENGGQVPLSVLVDTPQTAEHHATEIHVFATRNPTPGVAAFRLTPLMARAEVQTRMRLAEDQRILVVARMNDGSFRQAAAEIRVGNGGCLS
jgi:sulfur-oxidizing protein SoxY